MTTASQPIGKSYKKIDEIVHRIAARNETLATIARDYGISRERVSQIKKERHKEVEQAKAVLHEKYVNTFLQRTLLENEKAHDIVNQTGYMPSEETETFLKRQDYKGTKILESVGILESRNKQLQNYGNITVNMQKNQVISHTITDKLGENVLKEIETLSEMEENE